MAIRTVLCLQKGKGRGTIKNAFFFLLTKCHSAHCSTNANGGMHFWWEPGFLREWGGVCVQHGVWICCIFSGVNFQVLHKFFRRPSKGRVWATARVRQRKKWQYCCTAYLRWWVSRRGFILSLRLSLSLSPSHLRSPLSLCLLHWRSLSVGMQYATFQMSLFFTNGKLWISERGWTPYVWTPYVPHQGSPKGSTGDFFIFFFPSCPIWDDIRPPTWTRKVRPGLLLLV